VAFNWRLCEFMARGRFELSSEAPIAYRKTPIAGYFADAFDLEVGFWIRTLFSVLLLVIALLIPKVVERNQESERT